MNTSELTVRLPENEASFLAGFAEKNKITISDLIVHFVEQLRKVEKYSHHPDIDKFAGIIPLDIDVQREYHDHLEAKHR